MKKAVLICLLSLVFLVVGITATSFNKITLGELNRLWEEKRYEELLKIGQERLRIDPKDLVGLILVLQDALYINCNIEVASQAFSLMEKELEKVIAMMKKLHLPPPRFSQEDKKEISGMIEEMRQIPPEEIKQRRREEICQRFDVMPFSILLLDLQHRGFFKIPLRPNKEASTASSLFGIASDKSESIAVRVFRLWKKGKHEEVFQIGRERLKRNPNDLVGLILLTTEAYVNCDVDTLSQAFTRLGEEAKKIKTPEFQKTYRYWEISMPLVIEEYKKMSPQQLAGQRERYKNNILEYPPLGFLLIDLEEDDFDWRLIAE